jgi:thiamine kinase|nr:MAG: hypothetical protein DIU62_01085 [Pseudomonadota bacterium]
MIPAHVLAQVPGCAGARRPLAVVPLPGGEGRNEVVRIDTREGRFVWRRRLPPVNRPGALAQAELAAHRLAAAAGLAPVVLRAAPDGSWLLMEYVEGRPWNESDLLDPAGARRLGERLAMLHALSAPEGVPAADAVQMAHGYVDRLRRRDPAAAREVEPEVRRVEEISARLADLDHARALVHGDLSVGNLLGEEPKLVDWEYAQVSDPSWDWACLLSYYPALEPLIDHVIGPAGAGMAAGRARLALQRERFGLLNRLWERAYPPIA